MTLNEVLTLKEVAALLKIGEKTTYSMVQLGELPGFKVRGQWRFRVADIDAWMASQVARSNVRGRPELPAVRVADSPTGSTENGDQ